MKRNKKYKNKVWLEEQFKKGLYHKDVAEIVGVNISTISVWCRELGVSSVKLKNIDVRHKVWHTYLQNAKKRKLEWKLTKEEFYQMTIENCHYCDSPPSQSTYIHKTRADHVKDFIHNGIDRIDSTKGYTSTNTVTCCKICNWMKSDLSQEQFIEHVHKIYIKSQE